MALGVAHTNDALKTTVPRKFESVKERMRDSVFRGGKIVLRGPGSGKEYEGHVDSVNRKIGFFPKRMGFSYNR